MIEPGSSVAARKDQTQQGTVTKREFDAWSRDWLYDVDWADGTSTRVPFLALVEVTCADRKRRVKIDVDRAGTPPTRGDHDAQLERDALPGQDR